MKHIQETIDSIVYSYNPREFMPVRVDGELSNKSQFVRYKVGKLLTGHLA